MPRHITLVQQFEQQQAATWALAFSQDGTLLVSSDEQALSYFWKLDAHGHWKYERSTSQNISFPFSAPDGRMLAFLYEEEQVRLISLDGSEGATLPRPFSGGWTPSPDLRWALSNGRDRSILLWDFALNQSCSIPIPFPEDHRGGMDTDPSHGGIGCFLFTPSSHATEPIGGLAWSKTGYIATGGASVFEKNMEETDYTVKIWKIEE